MRFTGRTARVAAFTGLVVLAGCAGTEGPSGPGSTPSPSVPSMNKLSAALLTPADLPGTWTAGSAAGDGDGDQVRLITYDLQCPAAADALLEAERLEVDASTALGQAPTHGEVFVVEYLIADDPTTIERTFTTLRDGVTSCLGTGEGPQDGEPVLTSAFAIPEVGQDRFAVSTPAESGEGPPTMRTAYVRAGPVLLVVHTGADDSTQLADAALTKIITRAVDKLP